MNREFYREKIYELINEYFTDIEKELLVRWNSWEISMDNKPLFEVIGGLLSRQVAVTTYFLQSSTNWNNDFAPIVFRVLAENYLTISYILHSDSLIKAKQFIDYGLGREKLHWEKIKKMLEDKEEFEEAERAFKEAEEYWNQFKYFHHQDINLGVWTNKNMREICEEIDEKELYGFIDPMNDAVHGTFNHIIKHNLKKSDNPIHQYILVPGIKVPKPNIDIAESATSFLDKAFNKVDECFPPKMKIESSAVKLFTAIDSVIEEAKATSPS